MIGNFSPEKIAQLRKKAEEAKLKKNAQVRPEIVIPLGITVTTVTEAQPAQPAKPAKPLMLQAHRTGLFEISPERLAEIKAHAEANKKKKEEVKPVVIQPKPTVKPTQVLPPHKGRFGFAGLTPAQAAALKAKPVTE